MIKFILSIVSLDVRYKSYKYLKPQDSWATIIIYDWLAILIVEFTRKYLNGKLSPDHFTVLSVLFFFYGMMSLFLFDSVLLGSLLLFLSITFDCVDGKLARSLSYKSKHGAVSDSLADLVVQGFGFPILGYWVLISHQNNLTFFAILLFSLYISIAHVNNIQVSIGNKIRSKSAIENSSRFTGVITEVEISFLAIPQLTILFPDNHFLVPGLVTLFFISLVIKPRNRR